MTTLPTRKVTLLAHGVVSDPRICSGAPTVKGRRVTTSVLFDRFLYGEGIRALSDDYEMEPHEIQNAIRYEIARRLRLKGWLKKAKES